MSLGEIINKARKDAKLTLVQLGEETDLTQGYLSNLERNKRKPSPEVLERIATTLNLSHLTLMEAAGYLKEDDFKETVSSIGENSFRTFFGRGNKELNLKGLLEIEAKKRGGHHFLKEMAEATNINVEIFEEIIEGHNPKNDFTVQQISDLAEYLEYPFTLLYLISNNHQELFGVNITKRILEGLSAATDSSLIYLKDTIDKINEAKANGAIVNPEKFEHILQTYKEVEGTMEFDRFFKSKIFNENNNSLDLYDVLRNNNVKFKGKELNSKQKKLLNTLISEIVD